MTVIAMPKSHRDRGIEGLAARWYASNTGEMLNEYTALARRVAAQLPQGSHVLEVAPGPGYFCIELAKLGSYSITGLDISHSFVRMATKKAAEAGVMVDFKQGSAFNLPFPQGSFDFLLCRAAFKNFAQPVAALQEMHRVLRPGGRALIADLNRDATPAAVSHAVEVMGLSAVNRLMTRLAFKWRLLKSAYTRPQLEHMLAQVPFSQAGIAEDGIGFEITLTK
jgi:ubiquinone/menaquinone biosynthesis C-methylase UbiE